MRVRRGSLADLDALEPLWVAVHHQHARSMPGLAPFESLGVLPEHRGRGIGTRLLEQLDAALHDDGVTDVVVGALPGNAGAVRLYERHGFAPTWLYLSRFERRD